MFFPTRDSQLGGMFDYLYEKYRKNYAEIVETNQSSVHSSSTGTWSNASILITPHSGTDVSDNFASKNEENSNFSICFKTHRIKLISYTFQTRTDLHSLHLPVSWVLDASLNGNKWKKIDFVENSSFTNYNEMKTFQVDRVGLNRCFKFTMKGEDYIHRHYFVLHRIEFFGFIYNESSQGMSYFELTRIFRCFMLIFVTCS